MKICFERSIRKGGARDCGLFQKYIISVCFGMKKAIGPARTERTQIPVDDSIYTSHYYQKNVTNLKRYYMIEINAETNASRLRDKTFYRRSMRVSRVAVQVP
jgi:hypothetical protein